MNQYTDMHLSSPYPNNAELITDLQKTWSYLNFEMYENENEFIEALHEAISISHEIYERLYKDAEIFGIPYEH